MPRFPPLFSLVVVSLPTKVKKTFSSTRLPSTLKDNEFVVFRWFNVAFGFEKMCCAYQMSPFIFLSYRITPTHFMTFWTDAGCLISLIKKKLISRLPRSSFLHKHQLPFFIRQLVDLADVFREICQSSSRTSFSSRNGSSPEFVWKTNKKLWVTSDETAIFFPYQDFWLCTQLLVRSSLSTAVGVS